MANWCEERGFQTTICERRFRSNFRVDDDDPAVALCGIDNALGRAALEDVGSAELSRLGLDEEQRNTWPFRFTPFLPVARRVIAGEDSLKEMQLRLHFTFQPISPLQQQDSTNVG